MSTDSAVSMDHLRVELEAVDAPAVAHGWRWGGFPYYPQHQLGGGGGRRAGWCCQSETAGSLSLCAPSSGYPGVVESDDPYVHTEI
jgi:hypothetical protein